MPVQAIPARSPRFPIRAELDRLVDEAYVRGGIVAAADEAERILGWRPNETQLITAIGRNAWLLGEARGNQAYQLRQAALGIPMPMIDPDGVGDDPTASEDRTHFPSIERNFGIEIEFNRGSGGYSQCDTIVNAMTAAGHQAFNMRSYAPHVAPEEWRMGTDATVSGGEFVSPILSGVAGHSQVRDALRAVKDGGGVAGRSQGMHIHHDIRDHVEVDQMVRLIHNLQATQDALLGYVPRYRYDGSGMHRARRLRDGEWTRLRDDALIGELAPGGSRSRRSYYDRYVSFNFNAAMVYGSVEWRALGNTLNPIKVRTWIRVGQAVIWYGMQGHEFPQGMTAASMLDELVRTRALPRREAERFTAEVSRRQAAA